MTKKKKNRKVNKMVSIISLLIWSVLVLVSVFLFGIIISMKVIPVKFLIPILIAYTVMVVGLGLIIVNKKLKYWFKIIADIASIIFIIIFIFAIHYLNTTLHFMDRIKAENYQIEEYYVLVESDSKYQNLEDLDAQTLGIYESTVGNYKKSLDEVKEKVDIEEIKYLDFIESCQHLIEKEIDAVLISSIDKDIAGDEIEDFNDKVRVLYTVQMKVESDIDIKEVDVSDEAFNIYISGIDIFGNISLKSRSDVNMIVTVNPNTHKILMTSIPRDYYVQLHGTTGLKDKLTHAGIYGVNMSIQTLEDLLDIDINYYVRVNFTTLINLVDAIDGIDVYSDTAFTAWTNGNCKYKVGMMHLDGKCALAFARERHAYSTGDRHRVQNQQDVLSAILKKALSSRTLVTKYSKILDSMGSSFQTNIPSSSIYDLVNKQLADMPSWTFESYSLNGTDKKALTYSYAGQELYVMEPNMDTVYAAQNKIDSVMDGN